MNRAIDFTLSEEWYPETGNATFVVRKGKDKILATGDKVFAIRYMNEGGKVVPYEPQITVAQTNENRG